MPDGTTRAAPRLSPALSTHLDLLRFGAALTVLISHLAKPFRSGDLFPLPLLDRLADDAVMAFFVLSGFVIAYTTEARERGPGEYAAARLARLYSVALPALLLVPFFDALTQHFAPGTHVAPGADAWSPAAQLLVSAVFANELWGWSVQPFSNGPWWSVAYEFWYYVLFGIACYLRGAARLGVGALAALLVGPKILALFPLWLLGVAVWRLRGRVGVPLGALLFAGSLVAYLALHVTRGESLLYWWRDETFVREFGVTYSRHLPSKYVTGCLVACNILGFAALAERVSLRAIERPVRWLAGMTFTLYLFHVPLLDLFGSVLPGRRDAPLRAALLALPVVAACAALASVTERRKRAWRRGVDRLGSWLAHGAPARRASIAARSSACLSRVIGKRHRKGAPKAISSAGTKP